MPARCPDHVRERAMLLWQRGEKAQIIAAKVGVSPHTLTGWARKAGIGRPMKHHHPIHDFREEILRRYLEERKSVAWLADVYGFAKGTLYQWLKADGLKTNKLSAEEAVKVYRRLGSYAAVADVLGCTTQWARKLVKKASAK